MRYFILTLILLPIAMHGQSVTATYGNGDISTNLNAYSVTCNGPLTTLTVTLPAGGPYQVTGIDITYSMTAQGGGFKSHQRSQIHFQFSGTTESTVYVGTGDTGGIQNYSRTNVSIANGAYPGGTNLIFEMRAWRTSQGGGCNTTYNKVDNFTWTITVNYSSIPAGGSVGIGTTSPNSSAILDLNSVQKGFLLPTMTIELRNTIPSPAQGLLVYCTNCSPASIYQYRGNAWRRISGSFLEDTDGDTRILVEKNIDENKIRFEMGGTEYVVMNGPKLQIYNSGESVFIGGSAGMSDDLSNNANVFIGSESGKNTITGFNNIAIGRKSLLSNTTGNYNLAIGNNALNNNSDDFNIGLGDYALYANTTGESNIALGAQSLFYNTTGQRNIGIGGSSMKNNTTGSFNIGIGEYSLGDNTGHNNIAIGYFTLPSNTSNNNVGLGFKTLKNNTSGQNNTAIGSESMYSTISGSLNVATGYKTLFSNTSGSYNNAYGDHALYSNTSGSENTAYGGISLYTNTIGYQNLAAGRAALYYNTSGYLNSALGFVALYSNSTGFRNTAAGVGALYANTSGESNVAIGNDALVYNTTGSYNTGIGRAATASNGFNPSNLTAIGFNSGHVGNNSNTVEIGNTSVTWIGGQQLWSTYSDTRIKENIQSNVPGLEFINRLNPVTYKLNIRKQNEICGIADTTIWEGKYDIEKLTQTGFLAQEVYEASKEINFDFNGVRAPTGNSKLYSLQYAAFVVPLVKAVQELSDENETLHSELESMKDAIQKLTAELASLKELATRSSQQ